MPSHLPIERNFGLLEAAFLSGNEDQLVEELRKVPSQKTRRRTGASKVVRILEQTSSPRVRNAAALALADLRMTSAKDKLIEVLRRAETKGHRGTILYALDELGVNLPLSLLVDLIVRDSYETREEALNFLASGRIDYDKDQRELKQKLKTALRSADEDRSHAVNAALQYLSASEAARSDQTARLGRGNTRGGRPSLQRPPEHNFKAHSVTNTSNSHWIELAESLGHLGCDIVGGRPLTHTSKGFLEPKVLAITLMSRALSNFKGAITLLTNNLVVEARILVRCCYENAFWIVGLYIEGDKFARKMLHADVRSKRARTEFILSRDDLELSEEVERRLRAQIRRMNDKYPKAQPLNPQDVALDGVLRDGYLIYSQLSADAAHPSLESLNRHIVRLAESNERILDVVPAPKEVEVAQTWDWACNAMLSACVGVNEILGGTPAGQKLRGISDRYQALTSRKG